MRQYLWIGATVVAILGLAAWAPEPPAKDPLSQMEATPRLYQISATGPMAAQNGSKMCMGGDALRKLVDSFRDLGKDPNALKTLNKGCTSHSTHDGGAMTFEQDCQKSNGAAITSHLRISGTPDEVHQHMEMSLPGMGPNGSDKAMVTDLTMTYAGACPSTMKPGDVMMADGTIVNPLAAFSEAGKKSGDAAGAPPK